MMPIIYDPVEFIPGEFCRFAEPVWSMRATRGEKEKWIFLSSGHFPDRCDASRRARALLRIILLEAE